MNISDGGMLVLVDAQVQQAFPEAASIKLCLLDSINPEIVFAGRVARNDDQGLGVRLLDYEFRGARYPLSELRRQWFMSQADFVS